MPAIDAEQRAAAERALAMCDQAPRGCAPDRIAKFIATAALGFPPARLNEGEARARLTLYQNNLADIDDEILAAAFHLAMQECTFFPTIAELRRFASRAPAPRWRVVQRRLRLLLDRCEPAPAIAAEELVKPEQLRQLIADLGGALHA